MAQFNQDELKIYCVYHDPLLEPSSLQNCGVENYYTKEGHPNSLDDIQAFVNEFTAQAYVFNNPELKKPYIGFCHYRRKQIIQRCLLTDFGSEHSLELIGFYKFRTNIKDYWFYCFLNFLWNDFQDYIKTSYSIDSRPYRYFINNQRKDLNWLAQECFVCQWEYFDEVYRIVLGFLEYLENRYKFNRTEEGYRNFLDVYWCQNPFNIYREDLNNEFPQWVFNKNSKYRVLAFMIEVIEGFYFGNLRIEKNYDL